MKNSLCLCFLLVMAFAPIALAAPVLIDFVLPDALVNPQGVTLEAQAPEPGLTLFAKDAQRPKLWYAPVAAEQTRRGARVWYQRVNTGEKEFVDQRTLCLGEICDGAWKLTALNAEAPVWGGINNVCLRRSPHKPTWGGFNVFQLVRTGREHTLLYWDQPSEAGLAGAMLARSKNGKEWEKEACGAVFTEHNDAFTLMPTEQGYLLYQTALEDWPDKPFSDNLDKKRRVITLRRSEGLKTWSSQEVLLRPDAEDPPETEFYLMKVFPYGTAFAGLIMKYYADPALPGKHSAILKNELVVSADALHWQRPFRGIDVGFWSYANPVTLGDKQHFVIWKDGGMNTVAYAPQRMTAVCAGKETGTVTTRTFHHAGGPIHLNADTRNGWLEAELLSGDEIVGSARIAGVDGTSIPLVFGDKPKRGVYRLRFHIQNAKLYAALCGR